MFSRIIDLFRRPADMGKPARRGELIGDTIAEALEGTWPAGFERVGDLVWVSHPENQIRYRFQFQEMKGGTFSARWGVCIDFVPILRAEKLGWKRTEKTANFDLCIDPVDLQGGNPALVLIPQQR
ncbi:hypothetical protein RB623_20975 [Mesorhizobium sp. LHD-90]|uniref:hypothetical protein n=1 Tax=Mesorhizobium sp. LHD-90 TaxID=3071414 RepID=UPI0027DEDF77|nr:hypothetical protein [Mesorhizobium sp. LHD-90]MDQ6436531.1 hypothetical protein [Mesorhizobium sp. LHD-90]